MAHKQPLELKLENVTLGSDFKAVHHLIDKTLELNAGSAHMMLNNVRHQKDLTVVISVYNEQKPAQMVVDELTAWAEQNDPALAKRIEDITLDMSWNEKNPV